MNKKVGDLIKFNNEIYQQREVNIDTSEKNSGGGSPSSSLNINTTIINKIIFLNCNSLNELLLIEDTILEKLDIPINIINIIKTKIQEKLYISNIEF